MNRAAPSLKYLALAVVAVVLIAYVGIRSVGSDPYRITMLIPAADGTFVGARVVIKGETVGKVAELGVRDGQAAVTLEIDDDHAPLHAGTQANIKWESVIGARIIEVHPGKGSNPELPSGHLVTGNLEGVELDDLLATLDAPTRAQLQGLVSQLDAATKGKAKNLNKTLEEAGPTIKALGALAKALGEDGPAIKKLITQLHGISSTVAGRDGELAASIEQLNQLTAAVASQHTDLSAMLKQLPSTLDHATTTLGNVEGPVASTRDVLRTIKPSTARLPGISHDLRPVLAAVKPALADLPPTLLDADRLLKQTPSLVAALNDVLPDADDALEQLNPMVAFLRPYTPEATGWLTNWTSLFGSQNAEGNYARALITASASSLDDVQPMVPPGQKQDPRPAPGSLVDQAWTDANGDPIG